jgi:hypothetical protein
MVGSRSQAPSWVFAAQGTEIEALQSSKQIYTVLIKTKNFLLITYRAYLRGLCNSEQFSLNLTINHTPVKNLVPSKRVISSPFLHFSIFFSKILLGNPKMFLVGN